MLIRRAQLDQIMEGTITLAFRRWKRPTVKAGGELKTAVGVLSIESVDVVRESAITAREAKAAGYATRAELLDAIGEGAAGTELYRIRLSFKGEDPRIALRASSKVSASEADEVLDRLARYDASSRRGAWTRSFLEIIEEHPSTLAADLAAKLGHERDWFKPNVRKLKALGLTESLKVGYRLSPRGRAILRRLRKAGGA